MTARACPVCRHPHDPPKWSRRILSATVVCTRCGSILIDNRHTLREPDADEFAQLDAQPWAPKLRELQRAVIAAIGKPRCPHCLSLPLNIETWDGAGPANVNPDPNGGDVWVCGQCMGVALFTDQGQLRKPSADEWAQLSTEPATAELIAYLRRTGGGQV